MPLLTGSRFARMRAQEVTAVESARLSEALPGANAAAVFPRCSNPRCASGWMRLWRSRATPVFEHGWCCSPECTQVMVGAALNRELAREMSTGYAERYRHRIPLGLSLLEKGWITAEALKRAIEAQRRAGCGRLGDWLMKAGAITEPKLTRALALQWSCPVLGLELHDPEGMGSLLPRLFVDALRSLPLRAAAQRILYLCSEDRPDPVLSVALERMTGLRVETGIADGTAFRDAHTQALRAPYAPVELFETGSESALSLGLAKAIEKTQPVEARLVRVHDFVWLRMWTRRQAGGLPRREEVRDIVCSLSLRSGLS